MLYSLFSFISDEEVSKLERLYTNTANIRKGWKVLSGTNLVCRFINDKENSNKTLTIDVIVIQPFFLHH
jgi:hypothetical protein